MATKDTMGRLRAFAHVQMLLTKMELRLRATQGALYVAALLFVLLALVMANLAGFLALAERIGYPLSALVFVAVDAVLAFLLIQRAGAMQPGVEVESATEVRDVLLEELTTDAEVVRQEFMKTRADVERIRSGFNALSGGFRSMGGVVDLLTGALGKSKKKKS